MKRKCVLVTLVISFVAVLIIGCEKTDSLSVVERFFQALQQQDFETAGICLGDEEAYADAIAMQQESESYLQDTINRSFLDFVYGNLSYSIESVSEDQNTSEITVKVFAYNLDEILTAQETAVDAYLQSDEYMQLSSGEQYVAFCEFIEIFYEENLREQLHPVMQNVVVTLHAENGQWLIVPSDELFFAIAGGADN